MRCDCARRLVPPSRWTGRENRFVARVFVAIDDQRRIVGFYSLSSLHSPSPTCRPNMQNICHATTSFQLLSLGVSRVIREFAAKGSVISCSPTRFAG